MKYRPFGRTGWNLSEVSFGAWAIGGSWGEVSEQAALAETFSGVDYPTGVAAVEQLRSLLPPGVSMSQSALRWILMFDAVSCAIPGGKNAE